MRTKINRYFKKSPEREVDNEVQERGLQRGARGRRGRVCRSSRGTEVFGGGTESWSLVTERRSDSRSQRCFSLLFTEGRRRRQRAQVINVQLGGFFQRDAAARPPPSSQCRRRASAKSVAAFCDMSHLWHHRVCAPSHCSLPPRRCWPFCSDGRSRVGGSR